MACRACAAQLSAAARFCDQCGVAVRSSVEAGVAGRQTVDAQGPEAGDRRIVSALFADLVDYVRMVAEHDPEVVRSRVGAALGAMAGAIERFEGTREKFIGDAVFAVFGWPRAHEDDAVRAALCALAIRAALQDLGDGAEPLEVRIGVATGEVVAMPRAVAAADASLTGEAITTAARIQSLARPGEILLDAATVRAARDRLVVEDRGSVVLRGQSQSVRLSALVREEGFDAVASVTGPMSGPLVGRTVERRRIVEAIETTRRTGAGCVVVVVGEAGIGKTRLLADVESEARAAGFGWTWTSNVSYVGGDPYRWARHFAQMLADEHGTDAGSYTRGLLFTDGIDPATVHRFGGAIAAIAREAAFSGWEEETPYMPGEAAEVTARLMEVADRFVERMIETSGPRVIVVDDLHWLDVSSAGMIELLVQRAAERPLVVLLGVRPGPLPAWAGAPHVERIDLTGLGSPETAQLATLVARAALEEDDARRLHARTDGNPLFIGETVRASLEDGSVVVQDGRAAFAQGREPTIPLTLRAVLGARIDGLPDDARAVLEIASVVGVSFSLSLVGDLVEDGLQPGTIGKLEAAALIARVEGDGWRFSHPLIHEATYAGLLASRKRRLHGRLADRLEADRGAATVGQLARHRVAAGDGQRAIPLLVEAARSAAALHAATEAAEFWRTAAELAGDPVEAETFHRQAAEALAAAV